MLCSPSWLESSDLRNTLSGQSKEAVDPLAEVLGSALIPHSLFTWRIHEYSLSVSLRACYFSQES
jgi:hypothetical protein